MYIRITSRNKTVQKPEENKKLLMQKTKEKDEKKKKKIKNQPAKNVFEYC